MENRTKKYIKFTDGTKCLLADMTHDEFAASDLFKSGSSDIEYREYLRKNDMNVIEDFSDEALEEGFMLVDELDNPLCKERINYVANEPDYRGKIVYTGASVNFDQCCTSADTPEELAKEMKIMLKAHLEFGMQILNQSEPFEMKECTVEEWEARGDNITYWELDRMKRIMKRPEVQEIFKKIIVQSVLEGTPKSGDDYNYPERFKLAADNIAQKIIHKFVNIDIE